MANMASFTLAPKLLSVSGSDLLRLCPLPPASPRKRSVVWRPTTHLVRVLKDEQESPLPPTPRPTPNSNIDFDGKLPLFAPPVFRRRFVVGTIAGSVIALGADFLGSTSAILSLNPDFFRGLRADVLYPIGGYKRCLETSKGFEFIFPKEWVGDQTLLYRAVQRGERERSLDLPAPRQRTGSKPRPTEPLVAFGPPGTLGELNVSVVVAPVADGFTLEKLGDPREAGEIILKRSIAPEGSNKVATLLEATRRDERGVVYYTLEYSVQGPAFFRHNVAVYAVSAGELFTLNAQAPQSLWSTVQDQFRVISGSFRITEIPTPY
ncbi:hypothetical protein M758_9G004400 [Ceratodon purpureus]|uniref:PsbP C-terminal domain-containing protein n=1 Tax=Ceratodon purpureus TaxID=3225 RepID=A0A8T0GNT2_CERPU|nr:hypothetical protein KC19_9G004700 [Ceratodon purpureus]KAG0604734.1 hypothetical protein M758_9G004400 [Ceratodon purpureus]